MTNQNEQFSRMPEKDEALERAIREKLEVFGWTEDDSFSAMDKKWGKETEAWNLGNPDLSALLGSVEWEINNQRNEGRDEELTSSFGEVVDLYKELISLGYKDVNSVLDAIEKKQLDPHLVRRIIIAGRWPVIMRRSLIEAAIDAVRSPGLGRSGAKLYDAEEKGAEISPEAEAAIEKLLKEVNSSARQKDPFDAVVGEKENIIRERLGSAMPKDLFEDIETNQDLGYLFEDAEEKFANTRRYEEIVRVYKKLIDLGHKTTADVIDAVEARKISASLLREIIEAGDKGFAVHLGIVEAAVKNFREAQRNRKR